jgi:hypothetical protein
MGNKRLPRRCFLLSLKLVSVSHSLYNLSMPHFSLCSGGMGMGAAVARHARTEVGTAAEEPSSTSVPGPVLLLALLSIVPSPSLL